MPDWSDLLHTNLLKRLHFIYRQRAEDEQAIYRQLYEQRVEAWRDAIREEAARMGYRVTPRGPSRGDNSKIQAMCRRDAKSIVNTWNRDTARQLRKLFDANPKGNRFYYAKNMRAWAQARARWKNAQIARQTEMTARALARETFYERNGLTEGLYLFDGPPPVCPDCVKLYELGPQPWSFVKQNPAPVHINCTHLWRLIRASVIRPKREDLWIG